MDEPQESFDRIARRRRPPCSRRRARSSPSRGSRSSTRSRARRRAHHGRGSGEPAVPEIVEAPAHAAASVPERGSGMTTCTPSTTRRRPSSRAGRHRLQVLPVQNAAAPLPGGPLYSDMHPRRSSRAVQLGQSDMNLPRQVPWLCTGCETCTTRAPQAIDVESVHRRAQEHRPAASAVSPGRPVRQTGAPQPWNSIMR